MIHRTVTRSRRQRTDDWRIVIARLAELAGRMGGAGGNTLSLFIPLFSRYTDAVIWYCFDILACGETSSFYCIFQSPTIRNKNISYYTIHFSYYIKFFNHIQLRMICLHTHTHTHFRLQIIIYKIIRNKSIKSRPKIKQINIVAHFL